MRFPRVLKRSTPVHPTRTPSHLHLDPQEKDHEQCRAFAWRRLEVNSKFRRLSARMGNSRSRSRFNRAAVKPIAARYWHTPSWRSRPIRCCSRSLILMISRSNCCALSNKARRSRMESRCFLNIEAANTTSQKNTSLTIASQILNPSEFVSGEFKTLAYSTLAGYFSENGDWSTIICRYPSRWTSRAADCGARILKLFRITLNAHCATCPMAKFEK